MRIRIQSSIRAFTLIELLVVIAIISLLVSILVPSLMTAKRLAQRMLCQTHLRNMGTALQMYIQENVECIPPWLNARQNPTTGAKFN
jgi:prepilin-type N-terminal cleavage/methylation domain-containing protein